MIIALNDDKRDREDKNVALVVDDEALVRLSIGLELEEAGFDVITANDAGEAINRLESEPRIDVLLTDVEMPGEMDGLSLAHYARARWPDLTIVVNSGRVLPAKAALPIGAHFVAKPVRSATLITVLNDAKSMRK